MNYSLDTKAAAQADNLFSKIEEKGAYLGTFTRAEQVTSKKGSKGVDFSFKTETGATADYLTIWTHNGEGKQLQGFNTLMAIMTCLKVRELTATDGEVEKYDNDTKQRVKVVVPLFKELMNKPVGLLIHMEQYEKTAGGSAWKPAIAAPYSIDGYTASEILSKAKEATTKDKMLAALRDRPLKNAPQHSQQPAASSASFDDLGDDVPW
jgi:hypothetical protein